MSKIELIEQQPRDRARFARRIPISSCPDDTRYAADHRMLYVLRFGLAGAILTDLMVFVYFALFYASG